MAKIEQNATIYKDTNIDIIFTVENMDNITTSDNVWKMSKQVSGGDIIIEKTTEDPTQISLEDNTFTVHIHPEDTKNISRGEYFHEARILNNLGQTGILSIGKITIKSTMTSSTNILNINNI
jgi:hypothetical protein